MKRLPGYAYVDLGPDGGPFDQFNKPKVVVHTTQGSTLAGAEGAFRDYPPHTGYDPVRRIKRQYVSLDRHSYALRNTEAEDDFAIQVEVVGFAESTHKWSEQLYRNFAEDVILPLEQTIGVPRRHLRFYRANEGIVLASKYSPVRLSNAAWRDYSGWLGHQHSPNPDEHWDPGGFLMDLAFSFASGTPAEKEDPVMEVAREKGTKAVFVGDGIHRRWVEAGELDDVVYRFGAVKEFAVGTISVLGDETAESKARREGTGGPL